jgi:hypothetical protein
MRHHRAWQLEEDGELFRPQLSPIGQRPHPSGASQFGEECDGEQHRKRVAFPAPLARVGHSLKLLIECGDVKCERRVQRWDVHGECGRIHRPPFWCDGRLVPTSYQKGGALAWWGAGPTSSNFATALL